LIKFVSDLRQDGGFHGPSVYSTNKTDCQDITEILLKVMLSTIKTKSKSMDGPLQTFIFCADGKLKIVATT
jgi:hypothetical protein